MEDIQTKLRLFEDALQADIINRIEPRYSVALVLAEMWRGSCNEPDTILFDRLVSNWEERLRNHIQNIGIAGNQNHIETLNNFKVKYKNDGFILGIIEKIYRESLGL